MKKKNKKKPFAIFLTWLGVLSIVLIALAVTFLLYKHEVEKQVYTNNYTTSILFSDSLAQASGAAPWALLSLNWFVCRSMVKRWLAYIKKRFE